MKDIKSISPEELAGRLEEKAKELRESGLGSIELENVAGGGFQKSAECCGTACKDASDQCDGISSDGKIGICRGGCTMASPD